MPTMVQNILVRPGIANEDLFSDQTYYSGKEKKIRTEFDLNKIYPTPKELSNKHTPINEIKVLYYLSDKLSCDANNLEKHIKGNKDEPTTIVSLLSQRANIGQLYTITEKYTRSMALRKTQLLYDDGRILCEHLIKYNCLDKFEWQLENWGCAGNASSTKIIYPENNSYSVISFLTPDRPPVKAIKKLAKTFYDKMDENDSNDSLFHTWFPEDFTASGLIASGEIIYTLTKGHYKEAKKDFSQADLYNFYFQLQDDAFGGKMSAFNYERFDRLYFRLHSDLRTKFSKLCKLEGISISQAVQALAQKTVDDKKIPFDSSLATKEDSKYTGEMSHTNVRLPMLLRREFDVVVREAGSNANKVIVEYMMLCLDEMKILIKDET